MAEMRENMNDIAHNETDEIIAEIEERFRREYQQAIDEIEDKLEEYFIEFRIKDNERRRQVRDGEITPQEYGEWRKGQLLIGARWAALRDDIAMDYHNANVIAKSIYNGYVPDVYAVNFNWSTYNIEHQSLVNTGFQLYDHDAVALILRDDPDMLPPPGRKTSAKIAAGQDVLYNRQTLQSVAFQAVLQGKSIDEIAHDISQKCGEKNYAVAVRNARTMMTSVENRARMDAYRRAEDMGIQLEKRWIATLDGRTRPAHAALDGQTVPVNDPFESELGEIMYPGDPSADPANTYRCRCTTISVIKGFEIDSVAERLVDPKLGGMDYDEWKEWRMNA